MKPLCEMNEYERHLFQVGIEPADEKVKVLENLHNACICAGQEGAYYQFVFSVLSGGNPKINSDSLKNELSNWLKGRNGPEYVQNITLDPMSRRFK